MKKKLIYAILPLLLLGCTNSHSPFAPCEQFDIQGHRGARGYLPENSIPGFVLALEQGATTLEMDLVVSADAELVLSHEPWLNEKICNDTEGSDLEAGQVKNLYEMSMDEIRSCDCGTKGNPDFPEQSPMATSKPALWEVISVTEKLRTKGDSILPNYNIELKFKDEWVNTYHPEAAQFASLVIGELRELGIVDRTCIQSFNQNALEAVHAIAPEICTTWLIDEEQDFATNATALSFIPSIVSPYYSDLTQEHVSFAHAKGMKVIPWTVNTELEMTRLIGIGVDGIITDYPDKLFDLITQEEGKKTS
ncbi:MAG: glycerophosphodiester phosphodiesterase family protein [Flavobacteriales bacterium]|nr:glycerophosphodiester phosphodiesterase family protein [Flavobacteriales bacterium]MDG1780969.1 glycerophosphodiester phosphodiesterase family protein [Flavobacteriales bacterium]MDG2245072.1 glycerophosphodiester phosphodiesterase family protein [Flavobacteriales bacterium]